MKCRQRNHPKNGFAAHKHKSELLRIIKRIHFSHIWHFSYTWKVCQGMMPCTVIYIHIYQFCTEHRTDAQCVARAIHGHNSKKLNISTHWSCIKFCDHLLLCYIQNAKISSKTKKIITLKNIENNNVEVIYHVCKSDLLRKSITSCLFI